MATLSGMIEQLKGLDLERRLGLHPEYPKLAIELERESLTLVRLKAKRRGRPEIEGYHVQPLEAGDVPATIFEQSSERESRLGETLRALFEKAGIRPGKVSLVLPDNLAKLSLLTLPERPPSRKQLEELIRFKIRRGVPFKIADAMMSYQLLPSEGKGVSVFVALIRRALIERYEHALEAAGTRPGLIDLCTPNLLNLMREKIEAAGKDGDVALINCAATYFSLAIVRQGRLVFFRCKTYAMGNGQPGPVMELLSRELGYSLSYYEEKLAGSGLGTLFVRSAETPIEELHEAVGALEAGRVEPIDPVAGFDSVEGVEAVDARTAQRLAPALGAVLGRG
jgi:hypothetical protein